MQPKKTLDVNIRISRNTYKKLKVRAAKMGITLKQNEGVGARRKRIAVQLTGNRYQCPMTPAVADEDGV